MEFNIYKPVGISPLDAIKLFKENFPEKKDIKMTYAGRLDPMAEGVLLIVSGNDLKKFSQYLKLDKEYIGEILFGFSTDSYDILGMPSPNSKPGINDLKNKLKNVKGEILVQVPPFSSYRVKGRPLFEWAREGKISEIDLPVKKTLIKDSEIIDFYKLKGSKLRDRIINKLETVQGDFRQEKIIDEWRNLIEEREYAIMKVRISCSSGTYIRSIADMLEGTLFGLLRTRVGNHSVEDSIRLI